MTDPDKGSANGDGAGAPKSLDEFARRTRGQSFGRFSDNGKLELASEHFKQQGGFAARDTLRRAESEAASEDRTGNAMAAEGGGAPDRYPRSDLGNALRLVHRHKQDIWFVPHWRKWLVWDGTRWAPDIDGSIVRRAKQALMSMMMEGMRQGSTDEGRALAAHAIRSQSASRIESMIDLASTEESVIIYPQKLDADSYVIGVRNGSIDLRTSTFKAGDRRDRITKGSCMPAYDPDAACPNWFAFLDRVFNGDTEVGRDMIAYMQRVVGYVLTGLTGEEVMFVLWGSGANGKSTFRETIFEMLCDYAVASDASILTARRDSSAATPELAQLHGARLLAINETKQGEILNEARVKYITSHDMIEARRLYSDPFSFLPTHKTFVTTNHKPVIKGTDDAIWRRLHLIPFAVQIPETERDPEWRQKFLLPELPGILNWALEGTKEYWRIGLKPPPAVRAATAEYRGRWTRSDSG